MSLIFVAVVKAGADDTKTPAELTSVITMSSAVKSSSINIDIVSLMVSPI